MTSLIEAQVKMPIEQFNKLPPPAKVLCREAANAIRMIESGGWGERAIDGAHATLKAHDARGKHECVVSRCRPDGSLVGQPEIFDGVKP